jgi:hypothetical protein
MAASLMAAGAANGSFRNLEVGQCRGDLQRST